MGRKGMPKFRKKPVVIEAEQFDGTPESAETLCSKFASNVWAETDPKGNYLGRLIVGTREGNMVASPGDWIITGVQGERYPCKPDIFEATYERVSDNYRVAPLALDGWDGRDRRTVKQ